jgi:hypothetical protein
MVLLLPAVPVANATTFGSATRISTNTGSSRLPSVAFNPYAAYRNYVYVAWQDDTPVTGSGSAPEIWLRISPNAGLSFGSAIRISTNTYDSVSPSVAASGDYIYVVWEDYTPVPGSGSAPEIWLRVSSNNGASFGSATRITTNTGYSRNPSVVATGTYVYIAWEDATLVTGGGGSYEIWMRVSSNNGASFGPAIRITTNTGDSRYASIAASGSYVYVAWEDTTPVTGSGIGTEIWMRVSANNGATFGSAIRITTNTADSRNPSVGAVGGYVYVAWDDGTWVSGSGSAPEIWLRVSSNNGASFASAMRMSTNTYLSQHASVGASAAYVYVAWDDDTMVAGSGAQPEVWLRVSSNNGASFGSPIRITTNTGRSEYPSVAAPVVSIGNVVYVAWADDTPVSGSGTMPEIWLRVGS